MPSYVGVLFVSCVLTCTYLPKNPIGMPQGAVQSFWLLLWKDLYPSRNKKSYGNQALEVQMLLSAEKFVNLYDACVYSAIG